MQVLDHLRNSGLAFEAVPDLCALVAEKNTRLQKITQHPVVTIIACYPRTVRWLLDAAGIPFDTQRFEMLNMRERSADQIIQTLTGNHSTANQPTPFDPDTLQPSPLDKKPWFPVIDYDRCVDCKQCLDFCLFGVYTVGDDNKVRVTNPTRCKTDCPACARLCPQAAIIFPKYTARPINGNEVRDEDLRPETIEADLAALADTDVRAILRKRSDRRFSSELTRNPFQSPDNESTQ